jgi:hypothetical protein
MRRSAATRIPGPGRADPWRATTARSRSWSISFPHFAVACREVKPSSVRHDVSGVDRGLEPNLRLELASPLANVPGLGCSDMTATRAQPSSSMNTMSSSSSTSRNAVTLSRPGVESQAPSAPCVNCTRCCLRIVLVLHHVRRGSGPDGVREARYEVLTRGTLIAISPVDPCR